MLMEIKHHEITILLYVNLLQNLIICNIRCYFHQFVLLLLLFYIQCTHITIRYFPKKVSPHCRLNSLNA